MFGYAVKSASARPLPQEADPQETAIAVAGLAFLGVAYLQSQLSFNYQG